MGWISSGMVIAVAYGSEMALRRKTFCLNLKLGLSSVLLRVEAHLRSTRKN